MRSGDELDKCLQCSIIENGILIARAARPFSSKLLCRLHQDVAILLASNACMWGGICIGIFICTSEKRRYEGEKKKKGLTDVGIIDDAASYTRTTEFSWSPW